MVRRSAAGRLSRTGIIDALKPLWFWRCEVFGSTCIMHMRFVKSNHWKLATVSRGFQSGRSHGGYLGYRGQGSDIVAVYPAIKFDMLTTPC